MNKNISGTIEHVDFVGAQNNPTKGTESFCNMKLDCFPDDIVVRFIGNIVKAQKGDHIFLRKSPKTYLGDNYYDCLGFS